MKELSKCREDIIPLAPLRGPCQVSPSSSRHAGVRSSKLFGRTASLDLHHFKVMTAMSSYATIAHY